MNAHQFNLEAATEILTRTPATVGSMLAGLSDFWLEATFDVDSMSPRETVAHLIAGEKEDWIPRAEMMLAFGETRPFAPFDVFGMRNWMGSRTIESLLEEFASLRQNNLVTLKQFSLSDADLERTGTHPVFGRVTLRQLVATWVSHDLYHLGKISVAMGRRYEADVGPWKEYLSFLY